MMRPSKEPCPHYSTAMVGEDGSHDRLCPNCVKENRAPASPESLADLGRNAEALSVAVDAFLARLRPKELRIVECRIRRNRWV